MNYIGSKKKLCPWINQVILSHSLNIKNKTFCDLFAGTGIIGRNFKNQFKTIISNDLEYYSFILNSNYIGNNTSIPFISNLINFLNKQPLIKDGFIYKNYCIGSGSGRMYFSDHNGMKIDTIRITIEKLYINNHITIKTYHHLLASLLESADKVANTASIYGAFLKKIKPSAQKELVLEEAKFDLSSNQHYVYQEDANKLISKISCDVLYLDPPYNQRQYGSNYHLLNTIAHYKPFIPKGKTGLPNYNKSKYSKKKEALIQLEDLLNKTNATDIYLSYNNEGLMNFNEIKKVMEKYGKYSMEIKEYQRFKADKTIARNHQADKTYEYLHILHKN